MSARKIAFTKYNETLSVGADAEVVFNAGFDAGSKELNLERHTFIIANKQTQQTLLLQREEIKKLKAALKEYLDQLETTCDWMEDAVEAEELREDIEQARLVHKL